MIGDFWNQERYFYRYFSKGDKNDEKSQGCKGYTNTMITMQIMSFCDQLSIDQILYFANGQKCLIGTLLSPTKTAKKPFYEIKQDYFELT